MNWPHLHLALSHFPIFGTFVVLVLMLIGMVRKSEEIKQLALWFMFLTALAAIPFKWTGEFALEQLGPRPWLDAAMVERHEQLADRATTGMFVLGLLALASIILSRRMKATVYWLNGLTFVGAVATFILYVFAANAGGDLRHTEIRSGATNESQMRFRSEME